MKEKAESGVKISDNIRFTELYPEDAEMTENVLTIASFEVNPESKAAIALQSSTPIGENMGMRFLLRFASKLSSMFSVKVKFNDMFSRNHITAEAAKIIVNIFLIKDRHPDKAELIALLIDGICRGGRPAEEGATVLNGMIAFADLHAIRPKKMPRI